MIHVERKSAPKAVSSSMVLKWKEKAADFFNQPESAREQQRFRFETIIRVKEIKKALLANFHDKCAYCESSLLIDPDIDNFRPKSGAVNLDGKRSDNHYWWLAYEWHNLYPACQVCNMLKGVRFPVKGKRAKIGASENEILKEQPLLLDPCVDYPEEHLFFDETGFVASHTERGRMTIDIFNLNRELLLKERQRVFLLIQTLWQALTTSKIKTYAEQIKRQLYSPNLDYLAMRRQFLQQLSLQAVEENPDCESEFKDFLSFRTAVKKHLSPQEISPEASIITLSGKTKEIPISSGEISSRIKKTVKDFNVAQTKQESYSLSDTSPKDDYFRKARFIEKIEIRNFKVIEELDINFPLSSSKRGAWLLLLGENGTGKSSVLQAAALALAGDETRKLIGIADASKLVKYGKQEGHIRVHLTGSPIPIELKFNLKSKKFKTNTPEPKVLLLGYGATRLLPRKEARQIKRTPFTRPYNLFNPFIALNDANVWLCKLFNMEDQRLFNEAAKAIKDLFLLEPEAKLLKADKEEKIQIESPKFGRVYLDDLSAGYQSVLALITDVMSVLSQFWDSMEAAEGIVLIDEIDAHLHPRWKMQIIKRLRRCFPQVQFLVTSHEPLTLRGLEAGEVAVMMHDEEGKIFALTEDLPNPQALRIDQLLTSEFFGLNSTIDDEVEQKFSEYYDLLALQKMNEKQKRRLNELKTELKKLNQFGATRRERLMLEAADEYLAEKSQGEKKRTLKAKTKKKILSLWEKI